MSEVEISNGGVRIPTWLVGIAASMVLAWNGWISVLLIQTKEELVDLRAQVRSSAVPEGVERKFGELRERMNAELQDRATTSKLAIENAKDISYLMREVESLKQDRKK